MRKHVLFALMVLMMVGINVEFADAAKPPKARQSYLTTWQNSVSEEESADPLSEVMGTYGRQAVYAYEEYELYGNYDPFNTSQHYGGAWVYMITGVWDDGRPAATSVWVKSRPNREPRHLAYI